MRKPPRKQIKMTVTVSAPSWMTQAQARREVRTLINEQRNYMSEGPDFQDLDQDDIRVRGIEGAK